jgi:hypothetical protein
MVNVQVVLGWVLAFAVARWLFGTARRRIETRGARVYDG